MKLKNKKIKTIKKFWNYPQILIKYFNYNSKSKKKLILRIMIYK
jgi:hypothetical protein